MDDGCNENEVSWGSFRPPVYSQKQLCTGTHKFIGAALSFSLERGAFFSMVRLKHHHIVQKRLISGCLLSLRRGGARLNEAAEIHRREQQLVWILTGCKCDDLRNNVAKLGIIAMFGAELISRPD